MKRLVKTIFCFVMACALLFTGKTTGYAKDYTYTVTIYAGNQGTIKNVSGLSVASGHPSKVHVARGKDKITITGLSYGDNISCNAQGIIALDEGSHYYVMGIRLSGRDNNTIAKNAAFTVAESQDYVIAYGILGEMTEYTVNYVDEEGNKLADSQSYMGNVGDEPVLAYLYVDGYVPVERNITKKLTADSSQNVFEFVYKKGVDTSRPAQPEGGEEAGNETPGQAGNNANENNNENAGENNGEANVVDIEQAGGNEEEREEEVNRPVDIEDEMVPQAANNDGGPAATAQNRVVENGMLFPVIIGSVAAVVLITTVVLFILLKKRRKKA